MGGRSLCRAVALFVMQVYAVRGRRLGNMVRASNAICSQQTFGIRQSILYPSGLPGSADGWQYETDDTGSGLSGVWEGGRGGGIVVCLMLIIIQILRKHCILSLFIERIQASPNLHREPPGQNNSS